MLFKLISDPVTHSQSESGLAAVLASLTLSDCFCVCVCLFPPVTFTVVIFCAFVCTFLLLAFFCAFVSTCSLLAFFVHLFPHVCCWHIIAELC